MLVTINLSLSFFLASKNSIIILYVSLEYEYFLAFWDLRISCDKDLRVSPVYSDDSCSDYCIMIELMNYVCYFYIVLFSSYIILRHLIGSRWVVSVYSVRRDFLKYWNFI